MESIRKSVAALGHQQYIKYSQPIVAIFHSSRSVSSILSDALNLVPPLKLKAMRNLVFLLVLFSCSTLSSAQTFSLRFDHTNVLTDDLETSYAFYKDILQLEELETPWGDDAPIRFFSIGGTQQLHVAQVEHDGVMLHKGLHVAFTVQDFDAFLKYLAENGVEYSNFAGEINVSQLRPDNVRQIYFQDPDGYWIEINDASY